MKGYPDNLDTRGMLAGLVAALFSLGAFLGPVVGGSLIDVISFAWTAVIISGLNFSLAIVLIFYIIIKGVLKSPVVKTVMP